MKNTRASASAPAAVKAFEDLFIVEASLITWY
jgi:hypothetical protein